MTGLMSGGVGLVVALFFVALALADLVMAMKKSNAELARIAAERAGSRAAVASRPPDPSGADEA